MCVSVPHWNMRECVCAREYDSFSFVTVNLIEQFIFNSFYFIHYLCRFHSNTSHLNYLLANIVVTLYFKTAERERKTIQFNSIRNAVRRTRFCVHLVRFYTEDDEKKCVCVQYVLCCVVRCRSKVVIYDFFSIYFVEYLVNNKITATSTSLSP